MSAPEAIAAPAPGELFHRHGGKISNVTAVGHDTHQGVAEWFFVADIEWQDGTKSQQRQISPNLLVSDDSEASRLRVSSLLEALNSYLRTAGTWHEPKKKRGGYVVHWTPLASSGRRAVSP